MCFYLLTFCITFPKIKVFFLLFAAIESLNEQAVKCATFTEHRTNAKLSSSRAAFKYVYKTPLGVRTSLNVFQYQIEARAS